MGVVVVRDGVRRMKDRAKYAGEGGWVGAGWGVGVGGGAMGRLVGQWGAEDGVPLGPEVLTFCGVTD